MTAFIYQDWKATKDMSVVFGTVLYGSANGNAEVVYTVQNE